MKKEQLANRIGNIDDPLIQEAGALPKRGLRTFRFQRFLAAAAVLVLMLCSGTVGALAFSREVIVEVPVEQETIELPEIGLTLILPESWKGRWAAAQAPDGGWVVYSPSIKEACLADDGGPLDDPLLEAFHGGVLFYIVRYNEPVTESQFLENGWDFTAYSYLFATSDSTYVLYHASDVQFTPDTYEEYGQMAQEIRDIRIIVNGITR